MPNNIKEIKLWENNPKTYNGIKLVRIDFNFPCTYTILSIADLKQIIREWIKGEELLYPQAKFNGRWLLFEEIKKVFAEDNLFTSVRLEENQKERMLEEFHTKTTPETI